MHPSTGFVWLVLLAAALVVVDGATALTGVETAPAVISLASLSTPEAAAHKHARRLRDGGTGSAESDATSGSGSGDDGIEAIAVPTSGSSSGSSSYSATIALINSRSTSDVLDRLVQDALEAAVAAEEDRDAGSRAHIDTGSTTDDPSSSSGDNATVTIPPAPSTSPTPSPTTSSSSDKAFKLRVILIGVAGALVVLIMAVLVIIAWIRHPSRRRRSTSASIESLVLSPLDHNTEAPLDLSSANNSTHSYAVI